MIHFLKRWMLSAHGSFRFKTISSESIVEDLVVAEVALAGAVFPFGSLAVDSLSFGINLLFVSLILAASEVSPDVLFGATVTEDIFALGKISLVRFFASGKICDLVCSVWLFFDALVVLAGGATAFEEFAAEEEELVFGAAFLEAFVGAGGSGLIFNSESGSTPAPIGLK